MAINEAERRIVEFLDMQLFQPVLDTKPEDYPEFKRLEVAEVRHTVARTRERVDSAGSPAAVVQAFRQAAQSNAADGLDDKLRDLGLPTFNGLRHEVDKLAAELGVGTGR